VSVGPTARRNLLTSRPVTLLLIVWRYLMALFYAAEAIVVWWHPLPKFFVSGSLVIIAMVWVGMNIISREISRGERRS
jgi:hypothetical protein